MYCSRFNSAFGEERPGSVPSHSSRSSLPWGHHTFCLLHCTVLQRTRTHTQLSGTLGESKRGIRRRMRERKSDQMEDEREEERDEKGWRRGRERSLMMVEER